MLLKNGVPTWFKDLLRLGVSCWPAHTAIKYIQPVLELRSAGGVSVPAIATYQNQVSPRQHVPGIPLWVNI